ncbi:MAG: VWA domain-containing protein [Pyrinomonadaceae bacterium]|nr:VWA domain-containing protein [Pyrinomonadaceae bacterium]
MCRRLFSTLLLPVLLFTALALISWKGFVTVRASSRAQQASSTQGSLLAVDSKGNPAGLCPLKHTDVKAEVSGFISRVTVTQEFANPFDEKIEAVYTFPLPQAAAVDDMTMLIGERTIKGKVMRREEAQAAYDAAKSNGQVASLLDQERPNIFTQSVANIMPGQQIKVIISYVEILNYNDGSYEWSFPMAVGERYIPGPDEDGPQASALTDGTQTSSDRVPDAARITPPSAERPGHDISIEVTLDAGVPIDNLNSLTHEIEVERTDVKRARVRLKDEATIPNKDFVLKYDVAGQQVEDALLTHRSTAGGFFTFILQPPERVTVEDVTPKELVFVLDTSGSMEGFPIEKAKETMKLALDGLYPQDTFNLITFAGDTQILFNEPVPATQENLQRAKKFLASRKGDGGTEMMKAIRAALKPSGSQGHIRIVCFMTDGQVGNDMEILAEVQKYRDARVFAMGFGYSPNRLLLDKMAEMGRGEVEYATEGVDDSKVARRFYERVRSPLLTDISLEWTGVSVSEVYPKIIPDLFSAKPVVISGRYNTGGRGALRLRGKMSGRDFVRDIAVEFPENEPQHDVLATLWARRKIDDLMGSDIKGIQSGAVSKELREAITDLGLQYRLMTQFTSFVAIEDVAAANTGEPRRVEVPTGASPQAVSAQPGVISGTNIPSGVSACVTVMSAAASVDVTTNTTGTNVEVSTVENLPLRGRSLQTLVSLTPGVTSGAGAPQNPSAYKVSVNGQRTDSNNLIIDGVSANFGIAPGGQNPGSTAAGTMPALTTTGGTSSLASTEAVQELSVRTFPLEAQNGRVPGAQVEIITRSGTNDFHGSLFEYFGNSALDASDWFANSRGLRQPARRLNDFGGTFEGPLKKDRTFFFASYEGLRLRQPVAAITDVPSLELRRLAPAALQPFLNAYPLPSGTLTSEGLQEFAAAFANPSRSDAGSFRLDQMFGDQLRASARYNYSMSEAVERGANGFSLNTVNSRRSISQTLTGNVTYALSPTIVAELRANYSRYSSRSSYGLDDFGGAAIAPASDLFTNFFYDPARAASFDLEGRNAALMTGGDARSLQRQLNFLGLLTIVNGGHQLELGADYRRLSPVIGLRPFEQGVLFNGAEQALTGVAARVSGFTHTTPQRPVFNNLSVYGQDKWQATPRLVLNYGLRWEVNPSPSESNGRSALAVDQVDDISRLVIEPVGTRLWKTTLNNFAPRAGLAYQLSTQDGRELVVRGGFGLFYDVGSEQAGHAFADSYPYLTGRSVFNSPFQDALSLAASGGSTVDVPFSAFDPRLKLPYTLQWDFSVEQALGSSQTISASYTGAAGRRLLLTESLFNRNPRFSFIRLTTNGAESDYHSLQLQFNRRLARGLQAMVSYTLAKSRDDYSQDSAASTFFRSAEALGERGPSDFDVRHQLSGFFSYNFPSPFDSGIKNAILRNWTFVTLFNARSSRPLNVVYEQLTSYGVLHLRPDLITGVPLYLDDETSASGRRLNPAAFVVPDSLRQGSLSRNSLRGFPLYQVDIAFHRGFNFSDSVSLQFRVEIFNLFNHPNFEDPADTGLILGSRATVSDPLRVNRTFGQSTAIYGRSLWGGQGSSFNSFYNPGGPRSVQFSLKLKF